jgi:uncharacterized membrane protein
MPNPLFVLFELGVYMLATCCLYHAWHQDRTRLFGLVAGMSYGVFLEYATIRSYQAYAYGHFLIMLFESVPLCIGLSWGMIIYTAMETSDRFALPWYLRPVLDAFLALTIDLSMDAIAIRLGFWTWTQPGDWFGVPLANFYAWFMVVCGFSLLLRLGQLWSLGGRLMLLIDIALAILAITLSIVGLMALLPPFIALVSQGVSGWMIVGVLLGGSASLSVWAARRTRSDYALDLVLLSVPLFFHLFFFAAMVWAGIQIRTLLGISVLMCIAGTLLHLWPSRRRLRKARALRPVARFR